VSGSETPQSYRPEEAAFLRERERPYLLVSVRNGAEATAALTGGCDILDVKDPHLGAMGYAGEVAINEVIAAIGERNTALSVAAGEVLDWQHRTVPQLSERVGFAKMGLAGLGHDREWRKRLSETCERFDESRELPILWIAVAYADYEAAHAPHPLDVFESAQKLDCAGILIDTWSKSDRTVFDYMSVGTLHAMMADASLRLMSGALAGRLQHSQIQLAVDVHPTIIAVRSAACRQQDRRLEVDADAVRALHQEIQSATIHSRMLGAGCDPRVGKTP
jgi:uncharacterized protein (UPF0264 family)